MVGTAPAPAAGQHGGLPSIRAAYEVLGVKDFYQSHGTNYSNPHEEQIFRSVEELMSQIPLAAWLGQDKASPTDHQRQTKCADSYRAPAQHAASSGTQLQVLKVLDLACGSGEATLALLTWHSQSHAHVPPRSRRAPRHDPTRPPHTAAPLHVASSRSSPATTAHASTAPVRLRITACDPYTAEAYRQRTGCTAHMWSFEDIADGCLLEPCRAVSSLEALPNTGNISLTPDQANRVHAQPATSPPAVEGAPAARRNVKSGCADNEAISGAADEMPPIGAQGLGDQPELLQGPGNGNCTSGQRHAGPSIHAAVESQRGSVECPASSIQARRSAAESACCRDRDAALLQGEQQQQEQHHPQLLLLPPGMHSHQPQHDAVATSHQDGELLDVLQGNVPPGQHGTGPGAMAIAQAAVVTADAVPPGPFDLCMCSFALHLCEPSRLYCTLYQLSLACRWLVVLSPHKQPDIRPEHGWLQERALRTDRVHTRMYRSRNM